MAFLGSGQFLRYFKCCLLVSKPAFKQTKSALNSVLVFFSYGSFGQEGMSQSISGIIDYKTTVYYPHQRKAHIYTAV
jgi:hypothetical protein